MIVGPNPFQAHVTVRLALREPENVVVTVHDVAGRLVRIIHRGLLPAGEHRVEWDGTSDSGRAAATGLYLVRATGRGLDARARVLRLN